MRQVRSNLMLVLLLSMVLQIGLGLPQASASAAPEPLAVSPLPAPRLAAWSELASTEVLVVPVSLQLSPDVLDAIEACLSEAVTFVGDAVLVIHRTALPDGSRQLVVHSNPQGAIGVGVSSGTMYRLAASDTFVRIVGPSGTFDQTFFATLWVIGHGGHPRFGGPILLHVTVTPNGDVTADIVFLDKGFQCLP